MQRAEEGSATKRDEEVSLLDLLGFLRSNLRFFALAALVLAVTAVAVALLLPRSYERQLTLSVTPVPNELDLIGRSEGGSVSLDTNQLRQDDAAQLAVGYIEEGDFGPVTADPSYKENTQRITVSLEAREARDLEGIPERIVGTVRDNFSEVYRQSLSAALEAAQADSQRYADVNREILTGLDRQIEQLSSASASDARLQAIEDQRAEISVRLSQAEIELRVLEQAQGNLSRLAAEPVAIEVLDESGTSRSASLLSRVVVALLGALLAAGAVTVLRGALRRK